MQGTGVWSLVRDYSTCLRATKPKNGNYVSSRAHVPQQEKPLQWEAGVPQLEHRLRSLQPEKALLQQQRLRAAKSSIDQSFNKTSEIKVWFSFAFTTIMGFESQKRPFKINTFVYQRWQHWRRRVTCQARELEKTGVPGPVQSPLCQQCGHLTKEALLGAQMARPVGCPLLKRATGIMRAWVWGHCWAFTGKL